MRPQRSHIAIAALSTLMALQTQVAAAPVVISEEMVQPPSSNASPQMRKVHDAMAALDRKDLGAAESLMREAVALDPQQALPYIGLAEVAAQRGQVKQVDEWLKKALTVAPKSTDALRAWAGVQSRRGRHGDAVATLRKAVQADPKSSASQLQLGETYLVGLKQAKPAEAAYQAALALNPGSMDAQLGVAAAVAAQGREADAQAAFEAAAKLDPANPRPLLALARFQASKMRFDPALATLDRALAAAPDFLPAHLDKGDLLLAKGRTEQAAVVFSAAAKAVKEPAAAQFRLGITLQGLQRWDEAERAYLDAVKSDPGMFAAYNNLAFMAADRKAHLNEALGWVRKALELVPTNTALQDTLGWVHYARGEFDPAVTAFRKALAADPRQPTYHYHLGLALAAQGKQQASAEALNKALALNPKFRYAADARERLAQAKTR